VKNSKIRWCDHTWNPMSGCTHVSPGCDHCYAEAIATSPRFAPAFPMGFEPTFKPKRVSEPRRLKPGRVFVNSMSDVFHEQFSDEQVDAVFDAMVQYDQHDYLVLTKRPKAMRRHVERWLDARQLAAVPERIWLGVSIESDRYAWRADYLRALPVAVRFLSCEPLIGPLPSLDLDSIGWVIVGGESGNGTRDFRPMDHAWARALRDRCADNGVPFYFKQSAGVRTETGLDLDGRRHEEFPRPHPAARAQPVVVARGSRSTSRQLRLDGRSNDES
jgi:protein gp37